MSLPRHWLCFSLVLVVVAGCPRRFDPRANEVHSQNPEADAEYRTAKRLVQAGDLDGAKSALQHIQATYPPSEPLVGWSRLMEARIARSQRQPDRARELLQPLADAPSDESLRNAARFELGLAAHSQGDCPQTVRLLAGFSGQIVEGDEATELHAVLADCYRRGSQPRDALREYELFFRRARPVEQAYVRSQVSALLPSLAAAEQAEARSRFGIAAEPGAEPTAPTPSLRIGLAVPLSGKDRALGERVLRGALWSARSGGSAGSVTASPAAGPGPAPVDLVVRDTGGGAEAAAAAVAELASEGAQAVIASPSRAEAAAIARSAAARKIAVLHLATPSNGPASSEVSGFHLLYSNDERAQRLAAELRAAGLTSVAVLAPSTPYGQAMTRAFVDALQGTGIRVLGPLSFAPNATTFTAQAKQLVELGPQALFVPATATQLELVAGQLAALGALATQRVQARASEPAIRLVLSTAEGMTARLLTAAGRYLQGAVLAPVALAGLPLAPGDARFGGYAADAGGEAGVVDAIGYDAVQTLRAACAGPQSKREACSAEQLAANLALLQTEGATGSIAFRPDGRRRGQPLLVRIEGSTLRVLR